MAYYIQSVYLVKKISKRLLTVFGIPGAVVDSFSISIMNLSSLPLKTCVSID